MLQSLYTHERVAPMAKNIGTPCNTCIDIEDVNKGAKQMVNGEAINVSLISYEPGFGSN